MNIIFLHGKLSTPETSHTARAIKTHFESLGDKVFVPDYKPNITFHENIESYLTDYIKNEVGFYDETVIIGISLGGYWALYMANKLPITNCILLNPSFDYYSDDIYPEEGLPVSIFLNEDDVIVDPEKTLIKYISCAEIITFLNGGHRMENIEYVLPLIQNAAYSSIWD